MRTKKLRLIVNLLLVGAIALGGLHLRASAVLAASPPSLDGVIDAAYLSHGRALRYLDVFGVTGADLFVLDDPALDPNYTWAVWRIDRTYVDNSYGTHKHSTWAGQGHAFGDLVESDKQRLWLINTCGELVIDVSMDILQCSFGGEPSGCGVSLDVGESSKNFINGDDWTKMSFDTSLAANLNDYGHCSGGSCNGGSVDLKSTSPPWSDEPNYVPSSEYSDWEYSLIWEMRFDPTVFETATCPDGRLLGHATIPIELHASPPKMGNSYRPAKLFEIMSGIGDYVWLDADRDGVQDTGEPGFGNVTVALYSDPNGDGDTSDGAVIATTATDNNGRYFFPHLGASSYAVKVTDENNVLDGLSLTTGSIDPHTPIDLDEGQRYVDADFGYAPTNSAKGVIGDYVWSDDNNDGVQDPGEVGIGGVTLNLIGAGPDGELGTADDVVEATTSTQDDGYYLFKDLDPGDYRVDVTDTGGVLTGYSLTTGRQSSSDPTEDIHLNAGDYLNADFGYYKANLGTIGNLVWYDTNGDGVAGFEVINGRLDTDGDGDTDNADDDYVYDAPGTLQAIEVINGRLDIDDSGGINGSDDGALFGVDIIDGEIDIDDDNGIDGDDDGYFGEPPLYNISVSLIEDTNQNGNWDGGEFIVATTFTDEDGYYQFSGLALDDGGADSDADYLVAILDINDVLQVYIPTKGDPAYDVIDGLIDVDGNGKIQGADDGTVLGVDVLNGYLDMDDDNNIDGDDDGTLSGYSVEDGKIDINGDNLYNSDDDGKLPTGEDLDYHSHTQPLAVVLSSGTTSYQKADFGYWKPNGDFPNDPPQGTEQREYGLIGDYVWYDLDGDGVQVAGEEGIQGVKVELVGTSPAEHTYTDANGYYYFAHLDTGSSYSVKIAESNFNSGGVLHEMTNTTPSADSDNANDTDTSKTLVHRSQDQSRDNEDAVDLTLDFGYEFSGGSYELGDTVWFDDGSGGGTASDGDKNGTESGAANVTLILVKDTNGDGVWDRDGADDTPGKGDSYAADDEPILSETTTDSSGNYQFPDLPNGDYIVIVTDQYGVLTGYSSTTGGNSHADDIDGGDNYDLAQEINFDFGYNRTTSTASLGDRVWLDTDADGVQDAGETTGVSGVTVKLYKDLDGDGIPEPGGDDGAGLTLTDVTDSSGSYSFDDLTPANYFVVFAVPAGYSVSPRDQGSDNAVDSDANIAGVTVVTEIVTGESDPSWDLGLNQTKAAIGDRVWVDLDADGEQDSGESGLAGITVTLYTSGDVFSGATTTDSAGIYGFLGIDPGSYYISFTLPSGHVFSPKDAVGNDVDSDANTATGQADTTTLSAGENDTTWDAGVYQYASLGNYIWVDTDGDGVQEDGESAYGSGTTVELFKDVDGDDNPEPGGDDGAAVTSIATSAGGYYTFTNLVPGKYFVRFTLPGGYVFTSQDQGSDDAVDSDADTSTGVTAVTTLTSGENDHAWDAGIAQPASLGDYVWADNNGDGVQNDGATGQNGVIVNLYRDVDGDGVAEPGGGDGAAIQSTATASGGSYQFSNLSPGSYFVQFDLTPVPGATFTSQDQGGNDALDSDANPASGVTAVTDLASGENDPDWDAGLVTGVASLGDFVWEDLNGNGMQDGGEPGIENVTVSLFTGGGTPQGSTTADSNGLYAFASLAPGNYYVIFTAPGGYAFTTRGPVAGSDAGDSDPDIGTGQTETFSLVVGQNDVNWDAGLYRVADIGNRVWYDLDGDGVQDGGETGGVQGVDVQLYLDDGDGDFEPGTDDTLVITDTTDANGAYLFADRPPGPYFVRFLSTTLPSDYVLTWQDYGSDDDLDSDVGHLATFPITYGVTAIFNHVSNVDNLTLDAGINERVTIGNYVWLDVDTDGIQDTGEITGLQNITVTLYSVGPDGDKGGGDDVEADTTTTNSTGYYSFTTRAGSYYLEFTPLTGYSLSPQDVGGSDAEDSDPDPSTMQTDVTILTSGETDNTWDAGMYQSASFGDFVWNDGTAGSHNGIQNGGESGINGVTVLLYKDVDGDTNAEPGGDDGSAIESTTTSGGGAYSFTDLVPGGYFVVFSNTPANYHFTDQDQGTEEAEDSDANASGQTGVITLVGGDNYPDLDAGLYEESPTAVTLVSLSARSAQHVSLVRVWAVIIAVAACWVVLRRRWRWGRQR
jgi:hypothetical protein